MERNQENILTEMEEKGLDKMRLLNEEFLAKNEGSDEVRDFLAKAGADNALMLSFLIGRKCRPEHAWNTIKRYAEVRFDEYPEVFVSEIPKVLVHFQNTLCYGILKNRDQHGRRIICFNGRKWNPDEYPMVELMKAGVYVMEYLIKDEDALRNGIIFIQNCEGMGMTHVKQFTIHAMLRILNVLWYANPIRNKGIYFGNVPFYYTFVYDIFKTFLSKKMKERTIITTAAKGFSAVHSNVTLKILPKFLGGDLEDSEAFEILT